MNKPVVGIVVGAILGILDGATAWFTPAARPEIAGILMGSGVKGMVVGILSGMFARKVNSTSAGIAVGAAFGLLFAWLVAMMPQPDGSHYYVQIMVPGFISTGFGVLLLLPPTRAVVRSFLSNRFRRGSYGRIFIATTQGTRYVGRFRAQSVQDTTGHDVTGKEHEGPGSRPELP